MANVLPEQVQRKVSREYLARFVIALSLVSLAISFIAFLSLLPVEVALQMESASLATLEANAPQSEAAAADKTALTHTQAILNVVGPYVSTSSAMLDAIRASVADRPAGLTISSLSYAAGSKTISLVGLGTSVNEFNANLKADPHFTAVQVPINALVGNSKQFTLTLTGDF